MAPNCKTRCPIAAGTIGLATLVILTPRWDATTSSSSFRESRIFENMLYWQCNGRDETARVRNVSLGGLFAETPRPKAVGMTAKVDFLVQEGQIRAGAVVRHVEPRRGLDLKFNGGE